MFVGYRKVHKMWPLKLNPSCRLHTQAVFIYQGVLYDIEEQR